MPEFFADLKVNSSEEIPTYKYFCDGEWLSSKSGKTVTVFSPLNAWPLGKIQSLLPGEVEEAVEAAFWAQPVWERWPLAKKEQVLHLAADWLRDSTNLANLTNLLNREIGKNKNEAEEEIRRAAEVIDCLINERIKLEKMGKEGEIKEPYGVVLVITPFSEPVFLPAVKIAAALLTGNAVVLKPARQGTISTLYLIEIFRKAGLPAGVLNIIGGFEESGEDGGWIRNSKINFISFNGSTAVAEKISRQAGLKAFNLSGGGNNAAIVLDAKNLDLAAKEIIASAFAFSGQNCTGIKYVLGLEPIIDQLRPKLLKYLGSLGRLGPLINQEAVETVENRILKAKVSGAKILSGGKKPFFAPTVLDDVLPHWEIVKMETSGPVLSLIRVRSINKAIEIINNSLYHLQASIFTQDEELAFKLARRLNVATVQINQRPRNKVGLRDLEIMMKIKKIVIDKV